MYLWLTWALYISKFKRHFLAQVGCYNKIVISMQKPVWRFSLYSSCTLIRNSGTDIFGNFYFQLCVEVTWKYFSVSALVVACPPAISLASYWILIQSKFIFDASRKLFWKWNLRREGNFTSSASRVFLLSGNFLNVWKMFNFHLAWNSAIVQLS
jgi:hypothetical protein